MSKNGWYAVDLDRNPSENMIIGVGLTISANLFQKWLKE